ncbi:MAG: hypothetical protein ACI3ZY_06950 [Parabacteroides sp.]
MGKETHRPELIIMAGPNGSGKMYVTHVPLWAQAILPDTED